MTNPDSRSYIYRMQNTALFLVPLQYFFHLADIHKKYEQDAISNILQAVTYRQKKFRYITRQVCVKGWEINHLER